MKYILIIFLFLLSINLFAQDSTYYKYNNLIKEAENYNELGELKKALDCYDNAFKFISCDPFSYFEAFIVSINDSNYYRAKEYLIKGALKGLDISFLNVPEIDTFRKTKFAREYYGCKDSLLKEYYKSLDTVYYNAINEMYKLDQSIRGGRKGEAINDSINFDRLIALSEERGFPTYQKTGYGYNTILLILGHNGNGYPNSNQWKKIIPFIKKEILEGTLSPDFFEKIEYVLKRLGFPK